MIIHIIFRVSFCEILIMPPTFLFSFWLRRDDQQQKRWITMGKGNNIHLHLCFFFKNSLSVVSCMKSCKRVWLLFCLFILAKTEKYIFFFLPFITYIMFYKQLHQSNTKIIKGKDLHHLYNNHSTKKEIINS